MRGGRRRKITEKSVVNIICEKKAKGMKPRNGNARYARSPLFFVYQTGVACYR